MTEKGDGLTSDQKAALPAAAAGGEARGLWSLKLSTPPPLPAEPVLCVAESETQGNCSGKALSWAGPPYVG